MPPAGLALPTEVAQQRQMLAAIQNGISQLRYQFASEVYGRLAADQYQNAQRLMAEKHKKETDPFGTNGDAPPVVETPIKFNLDVNPEAQFAVHAANVLLHHLGLLKLQQKVAEEIESKEISNIVVAH